MYMCMYTIEFIVQSNQLFISFLKI